MIVKGTITFEAEIDNILGMTKIHLGNSTVVLIKGDCDMTQLNAISYLLWQGIQRQAWLNPQDVIHSPETDTLREICNGEGVEGFDEDNLSEYEGLY